MNLNDVVVLIPYFNDKEGIRKTLASIAESVNVLIVDDGSKTPLVIDNLKAEFTRLNIFTIRFDVNKGIVAALNVGLNYALSNGFKYVARLDSGDTVIGERFSRQKEFLVGEPSVKLVGGWANFVDEDGEFLFQLKHPLHNLALASAFFKYNPFLHPAVMFDICVYEKLGGYPSDFDALEDYAYFWEVSKYFEVANLPLVMLNYEVSANSISSKKRITQSISKIKLIVRHFDFSFLAFYGLIKSIILLLIPRRITTLIKTLLWR